MKFFVVNILLFLILSSKFASGGILFTSTNGILDSIAFTEDISFAVTGSGEDANLVLVLKDVYSAETRIESFSPTGPELWTNATAELNSSISSDGSWFSPILIGQPDSPPGIDIQTTDLSILYSFSTFDPFETPWSLAVGDSITIKKGEILALNGVSVPAPDEISTQVFTQIFGGNFPIVFTEEIGVTVVPEAKKFGYILGLIILGMIIFKRASRLC